MRVTFVDATWSNAKILWWARDFGAKDGLSDPFWLSLAKESVLLKSLVNVLVRWADQWPQKASVTWEVVVCSGRVDIAFGAAAVAER